MLDEISAAVIFLVRLIAKNENFKQEQLNDFKARLSEMLVERFENHWFPDKPCKGQGYRCLRVNEYDRREVTLERAAIACGFRYEDLRLPVEFTIWVDPKEVCCRFGEHRGSFCTLASFDDKENGTSIKQLEEKIKDHVEEIIVKESRPKMTPLSPSNAHRNSKRRGSGNKGGPRGGNNNKLWNQQQGHVAFPHPLQSWYNLLPQHWAPPSPPPYPHPAAMLRSSPGGKWGGPTPPHHRYHWQAPKQTLKV